MSASGPISAGRGRKGHSTGLSGVKKYSEGYLLKRMLCGMANLPIKVVGRAVMGQSGGGPQLM